LKLVGQYQQYLYYRSGTSPSFSPEQRELFLGVIDEPLNLLVNGSPTSRTAAFIISFVLSDKSIHHACVRELKAVCNAAMLRAVSFLLKVNQGKANFEAMCMTISGSTPDLTTQRGLLAAEAVARILRSFSGMSLLDRFFTAAEIRAFALRADYAIPGTTREGLLALAARRPAWRSQPFTFAGLDNFIYQICGLFSTAELVELQQAMARPELKYFRRLLTHLVGKSAPRPAAADRHATSSLPSDDPLTEPPGYPSPPPPASSLADLEPNEADPSADDDDR
jgi:hypothetical protein